jgi:hypothetical protein
MYSYNTRQPLKLARSAMRSMFLRVRHVSIRQKRSVQHCPLLWLELLHPLRVHNRMTRAVRSCGVGRKARRELECEDATVVLRCPSQSAMSRSLCESSAPFALGRKHLHVVGRMSCPDRLTGLYLPVKMTTSPARAGISDTTCACFSILDSPRGNGSSLL